jgi:SAM-dependent methyltransferase
LKRYVLRKLDVDSYCKEKFLRSCSPGARVLDVGCGNNSPLYFKTLRPDFYYVGLDVSDYAQTDDSPQFADEYLIEKPETFNQRIVAMAEQFDVVVSSHNIEHCHDPIRTMEAMLTALKTGGRIFISFPCQASVYFPHRAGCLNFYDDASHSAVPEFDRLIALIMGHGFTVDVAIGRYRPRFKAIQGFFNERRSRKENRVLPGTWAYYGFESIIWASRRT